MIRVGRPDRSQAGRARELRYEELRRVRAGLGITPAGEALLTAAAASDQRVELGLGTAAVADTTDFLSEIQDEGVALPTRSVLSFAGAGVTATDTGSKIVVTIPGGGSGSVTVTTVEVNLGTTAKFEGSFTITDAAIAPTSAVFVWQAPGPYTDKGARADEAVMQPVRIVAVEPGTGSAIVHWQTPPIVAMSRARGSGGSLNAAGATFDRLVNQRLPDTLAPRRLGRVRGAVKFSYMVL